ncbi:unnamed protein product [Closterium sp. NIES-65]|nr:unnamed protein product [Closterium sp. NIES-65]
MNRREYARRGATVYATARRLEAMRGLQEQGVTVLKLDVTNAEDIQHAVETVMKEAGRIDVLVNNAAVFATRPLADTPLSDWRVLFETNLLGVFSTVPTLLLFLSYLPPLLHSLPSSAPSPPPSLPSSAPSPPTGSRACHSPMAAAYSASKAALNAVTNCMRMDMKLFSRPPPRPSHMLHLRPMAAAYSASKAALNAVTNCMRMEMKPFGVRVMLAVPGFINTNIHR